MREIRTSGSVGSLGEQFPRRPDRDRRSLRTGRRPGDSCLGSNTFTQICLAPPIYAGGPCVCHSVARSYAAPARISVASPSGRPTSWRLGGGPPLPGPPGIERVGLRLMLNGAVNASSGFGSLNDLASGGIASLGKVAEAIEEHTITST